MTRRPTRTEKLDLRLTPDAKRSLVSAATAECRSLSDFVLQSALDRAKETLANRCRFNLDAERWAAFMAALDAPPRDLPRIKQLLNEPGIFSPRTPA